MDTKLISPIVGPSLVTTAELMRRVAQEIDALPGGQLPPAPQERAALRSHVRDLLHQLDCEKRVLAAILSAALD